MRRESACITVYCTCRGGNRRCVLPMVFVLIWCLEDGGAGYPMPPSQVVGSVWRVGWLPDPGLLSRRPESAAGGRRYWSPPGIGTMCLSFSFSFVREPHGKTYKQEASGRHTIKKQGPGIQVR